MIKNDEQKFNLKYQKNVMENKDRMISNLNEMREESEEKCSKLEHELNVRNTVLKELEDELEQKSNLVHEQEDVKELLNAIETPKHMNEGKELEIWRKIIKSYKPNYSFWKAKKQNKLSGLMRNLDLL